jgi:hypothetical protein
VRPAAVRGFAIVLPAEAGGTEMLVASGSVDVDRAVAVRTFLAGRVPRRMLRRMTTLGSMVVGGGIAALEHAGVEGEDLAHAGSVFGTAYGEIAVACRLFEGGLDAGISPTAFHNSVHNASLGYLSMFGGVRGPSLAVSDSTLSGEEAVLEAMSLLEEGAASLVVVGSGDESCPSLFSPCWRAGEEAPRATARSTETRDRLVTDQGAGFLVLGRADDRTGSAVRAYVTDVSTAPTAESLLDSLPPDPDLVVVPADLYRGTDGDLLSLARRRFGPSVPVVSEGALCGYVPAAGVIRCVLATTRVSERGGRAVVLGRDLDDRCAAVTIEGPGREA